MSSSVKVNLAEKIKQQMAAQVEAKKQDIA
jgi:hypothetical protein